MDQAGQLVFIAAIAFLLGFKVAAWMGKRHLERMRTIWKGLPNG